MIEDFGEFGSKLKSFGDRLKADTSALAIKSSRQHTRDMKANLMDFMMGERMESSKSPRVGLAESNEDISTFMRHEDSLSEGGQELGLNLISITNLDQKSTSGVLQEPKGYQRMKIEDKVLLAINNQKRG